ncbi:MULTISPECIES: hypothetical protein [Paenibacillus]|uniref:hypothetical protein n=1 Tax=Paenibacillus TaxID=44249 RepID=UPI00096D3F6D|nr:hypothetical protein [Paenibacillus odorifer]OMD17308.1 hypothetical protein BJP50_16310 [Paenibacillus odorifer]
MSLNFFDHREIISRELVAFLRLRGYSKLSFSKLSNISRATVDRIIEGEGLSSTQYNEQIDKINKTFDLPDNYFITSLVSITPTTYTYSGYVAGSERSPKVKELLDGLDSVLEIYSLYLK